MLQQILFFPSPLGLQQKILKLCATLSFVVGNYLKQYLSFNKFKFRPPGSKSNSEKITCIAIDNQVVSKQDLQVNLVNQEVVAIKQEVVTSNTDKINDSESDSESESDSDHDSEIIPKTKKTTKRVTKK